MSRGSMRVVLAVTNLGGGGAERHVVRLANAFHADPSVDVAIATLRPNGAYVPFLDDSITHCAVGPRLTRRSTVISAYASSRSLAGFLRSWNADIVVSFLQPMSWACARACGRLSPHERPIRVAAVQNNFMHQGLGRSSKLLHGAFVHAIETADHVIAISKGVGASLVEMLPAVKQKCSVAYNAAVDMSGVAKEASATQSATSTVQLVACGRLVPQKGFDTLLQAISALKSDFDIRLALLGDGPQRGELEQLAVNLGIRDRVDFKGFVSNPLSEFRAADLFVLSSRWEGFGNVIVESMSVGTPVVATNCPFGPAEIITHEGDGWLADDVSCEGLVRVLKQALSSREDWSEISSAALQRARAFTAEKIAADYVDILRPLVSKKPSDRSDD